jgi:hypothetical protein
VTDRLRELVTERDSGAPANPKINRQIEIFLRRAHILRLAVGAALVCVLLASDDTYGFCDCGFGPDRAMAGAIALCAEFDFADSFHCRISLRHAPFAEGGGGVVEILRRSVEIFVLLRQFLRFGMQTIEHEDDTKIQDA